MLLEPRIHFDEQLDDLGRQLLSVSNQHLILGQFASDVGLERVVLNGARGCLSY